MEVGPVLVIDDSADLRELFEQIFETCNIWHIVVESVASAFEKLAIHQTPVVIFCDYFLQSSGGPQFIAQLKNQQKYNDVPVVLVSAANDLATLARQANAAGYIKKPIDFDDLVCIALAFREKNFDRCVKLQRFEIF